MCCANLVYTGIITLGERQNHCSASKPQGVWMTERAHNPAAGWQSNPLAFDAEVLNLSTHLPFEQATCSTHAHSLKHVYGVLAVLTKT